MITNLGSYNPFAWHQNIGHIRSNVVYKLKDINFLVKDSVTSAELVDITTGSSIGLTVTEQSYTISGVSVVVSKITGTIGTGTYYINIDSIYYSDLIVKSTCGIEIDATNLCDDLNYNWSVDPFPVKIMLDSAVQSEVNEYQTETEEVITETGSEIRTVRLKTVSSIVAVLPKAFFNILNAIAVTETIRISNREVKNLKISKEDIDNGYGKFTISFQFKDIENKNGCCEELNLDSIVNIGTGGGGSTCTGYNVTISNASGTLTASATGLSGQSVFRWYRNGQFVASGSSLVTNGVFGEYKVEATNTGCFVSALIYLTDPCEAMQIQATNTANVLNANITNEISGTTYEVRLNGSLVATSLPYTATTGGVYFIYAIKGNCKKVSGVNVVITTNTCTHTASITKLGNKLTAVTNASSPTYNWTKEDQSGISTIGGSNEIIMSGEGIYTLTVTVEGCNKTSYYLQIENKTKIINALTKQTGYEFTAYNINLLAIQDPASELQVRINGIIYLYSSSTPANANIYTITNTGKIAIWSSAPLTNGYVIIETL